MDGRDERGRFTVGNGGGPGRPRGSALAEFRRIVNGQVEELINRVMEQALDGNLTAARLILERTHPAGNAALLELAARLEELEQTHDEPSRDPEQDSDA